MYGQKMSMFVIILALTGVQTVSAVTATEMADHLNQTFLNYYTYVRPVIDQSQVVTVSLGMTLIGINNFDNQGQKLTTTSYLEIVWTDELLHRDWSNTNINMILLPQTDVWIPDLALQNGFKSLTGLGSNFSYVEISKGTTTTTATWKPYEVFDSACEVDVTFFPFDTTTCDLKFVIWSNTKDLVKVSKSDSSTINMEFYGVNSEWDILSTSVANFETQTASGVTFSITMKRKPLFYILNILLPVVLLALLNTGLFVLPASAGEKVGYSVTTFLAFSVFLIIIADELPQNSEKVSVFGMYLALMTFSSSIIVAMTLIQLRLANRPDDHPIPGFLERLARSIQRFIYAGCCCVGTGHVIPYGSKESRMKLADEVSWASVSDALDFVFFFGTLIYTTLMTVVCVVIASAAPTL